jgi:hypothetical protein
MANVVKLKRSAVQGRNPTVSDLQLGEVALNTYDGNLFFKKDQDGSQSIVEVVTVDGEQFLANKTFSTTTVFNGDLDLSAPGTGILDDQGSDGSSGQVLTSTGQGVRWQTQDSNTLEGLTDVTFNGLESGQIIKYNGVVWVNADEQAVVTSAVFAANATSDLGPLSDQNISATEDLEPEHETETQPNGMGDTNAYYNMGSLAIDGVVGLRNVDQSLKSDYISYSIIFGF